MKYTRYRWGFIITVFPIMICLVIPWAILSFISNKLESAIEFIQYKNKQLWKWERDRMVKNDGE